MATVVLTAEEAVIMTATSTPEEVDDGRTSPDGSE